MRTWAKVENHQTFGEVRTVLRKLPQDAVLHIGSKRYYPALEITSYRGEPADVQVDYADTPVTVGDFLAVMDNLAGKKIEAYKGGEYVVSDDRYMWGGPSGYVTDIAVNGVCVNADDSYTLTLCRSESY